MFPTNKDSKGCSPVSSNCVIWQGPDIACLKLCKGDTVTQVVYKLAKEFCDVLEWLDVDQYDLACFEIEKCSPDNFKELLQFLIGRICALEGIETPSGTTFDGCPDCVVNIATCFYYEDAVGDTQTTMQLKDYVLAIGNLICNHASVISQIRTTLTNHENRLTALERGDADVFENVKRSAASTEMEIVSTCVLGSREPAPVSVVLKELEKQFCELTGATGSADNIYEAILKQCTGLATDNQLAGSGTMASIPGWSTELNNLAQAFSNIWLTLCDTRAAIKNIQANCCPKTCDAVSVSLTASLNPPNDLRLFFSGTVPSNFTECNPTGTLVTITDSSGDTFTIQVPVLSNINNGVGYQVDLGPTPVNSADDLTITAALCFRDPETGTECQSVVTYVLTNTSTCPSLILVPTQDSISYEFNWTGGAAQLTTQLYDSSGTVLIQSHTQNVPGVTTVSNTFAGLTSATSYRIRVKVNIDGKETICPYTAVSTLEPPCLPPNNVNAVIN